MPTEQVRAVVRDTRSGWYELAVWTTAITAATQRRLSREPSLPPLGKVRRAAGVFLDMRQFLVGLFVVVGITVVGGVHREDTAGGVKVARADRDGLDGIAETRVVIGNTEALASCASWDVKDNCCPAGCAAKKGTQWPKADDILRGCMRGLGCDENDVKGATVFMKCDCK